MPIDDITSAEELSPYKVKSNEAFLHFRSVEETKHDETKPWKPAVEVRVAKADGTIIEGLDASTPFFIFEDAYGNKFTVSAAAAGHIDKIHIKSEDAGSKFDESSLQALFKNAAAKMPEGIALEKGVSAFDIEMGKSMGQEGIASMQELKKSGELTENDITIAQSVREEVKHLNKEGSLEEKNAFAESFQAQHPDCKIQFQIIRGNVLVPTVDTPKRETTKLFMVFGPDASGEQKTLYTIAQGRNMPRHPNPDQHKSAEGALDEETFEESANAWFDTVMLMGK